MANESEGGIGVSNAVQCYVGMSNSAPHCPIAQFPADAPDAAPSAAFPWLWTAMIEQQGLRGG